MKSYTTKKKCTVVIIMAITKQQVQLIMLLCYCYLLIDSINVETNNKIGMEITLQLKLYIKISIF